MPESINNGWSSFDLTRDGAKQETDVIAEVGPREDGADEPAGCRARQRRPTRTGPPRAPAELVAVVTARATEQLHEVPPLVPDDMHCQQLGLPRDAVGVVADRQADQEPGRIDTALGEKPTRQPARWAPVRSTVVTTNIG